MSFRQCKLERIGQHRRESVQKRSITEVCLEILGDGKPQYSNWHFVGTV